MGLSALRIIRLVVSKPGIYANQGKQMNKQVGISLISLLIGLLISSFVLVGMMMVFRNTIQMVVPASEASRSDGERVSALLSTQILLQEAGFGITDAAYGTHLRILNGASQVALGTANGATASGDTVVWLKNINGTVQCEGLRATNIGSLERVSCNSAMGNITAATQLILPSQHADGITTALTITARRGTCRPFGVGSSGNITVSIAAPNSTGHTLSASNCLVNYVTP